jgi:hypothetical protein
MGKLPCHPANLIIRKQMKKLFFMMLFGGITSGVFAQFDMSYSEFTGYLKQEMTEKEFRSVDNYFGGNISGLVCFHEYGEFSGDTLDDFVVLTHEDNFEYGQKIYVYVFTAKPNGTFEFVDKVSFNYWRSRYEVAVLIRRGVLFVTSTDFDYDKWTWNVYKVKNNSLELVSKEVYQ